VRFVRRLLDLLSPARRLFGSTGVRRTGPTSLLVTVDDRSYWVHVQTVREAPPECRVDTSDIRDITNTATVVAAPPASASAVPEVRRRLQDYFTRSRIKVTYR
jgi:hypothetical protein